MKKSVHEQTKQALICSRAVAQIMKIKVKKKKSYKSDPGLKKEIKQK